LKVPELSYAPLQEANSATYAGKKSSLVASSLGRIDEGIALNSTRMGLGASSLKLAERRLDLNDKAIRNRQTDSVARLALNLGDLALKAIPEIANIVKQSQLETAKSGLLDIQAKYNVLQETSILNGKSSFVQGADGQLEFQEDLALEQWRSQRLAEIDGTNAFKDVKAWTTAQAKGMFMAGQDRALTVAVNNARTVANESFQTNMDSARTADLAGEGYDTGLSLIESNTMIGPAQKEYMKKAYTKELDYQRASSAITGVAESDGAELARTLMNGKYKGQLSPEQIDTLENEIIKADRSGDVVVSESAYSAMYNGMKEGKSPDQLKADIAKTLSTQPDNRKALAYESIIKAQTLRASEIGESNWKKDRENATIMGMRAARDRVASDPSYRGVEDVQNIFLNRYDSDIAAMERAEASSLKSADAVNGERINAEATYTMFKNGTISGTEAITRMMSYSQTADDVTMGTINGLMDKVRTNIVPEKHQKAAGEFWDRVKVGIVGDRKPSDFTDQQWSELSSAKAWVDGAILDLYWETSANDMTTEKFSKELDNINMIYTSKELKAIQSGSINVGPGNTGALKDALSKQAIFDTVDPVYVDHDGSVNWAKPEYKATYDQMNMVFRADLESKGITIKSQTMQTEGLNDVVPRQIFLDDKGNEYFYDGKGLNRKAKGQDQFLPVDAKVAAEIAGQSVKPLENKVKPPEQVKQEEAAKKLADEQSTWADEQTLRDAKTSGIRLVKPKATK
jgi:hypothetical protein